MKGTGALNLDQQDAALSLLRGGMKQHDVAAHFGVTKNTIAGIWARAGGGTPNASMLPTTLFERCDALWARMNQVMSETRITYVKPPVKSPSTHARPAGR